MHSDRYNRELSAPAALGPSRGWAARDRVITLFASPSVPASHATKTDGSKRGAENLGMCIDKDMAEVRAALRPVPRR